MTTQTPPRTKALILPVTGRHCATCSTTVARNLKRMKGVSDASVSYASERASVVYDPELVSPQEMETLLHEIGYGMTKAEADLAISGMTCNNCAATITRSLKRLDGVIEADASYASERATVTYLPSMVEMSDIKRAIRDAGYKVIETEGMDKAAQVDAEQAAREADIRDKRNKLIVGAILSAVIMTLSMGHMVRLNSRFPGQLWAVTALTVTV